MLIDGATSDVITSVSWQRLSLSVQGETVRPEACLLDDFFRTAKLPQARVGALNLLLFAAQSLTTVRPLVLSFLFILS